MHLLIVYDSPRIIDLCMAEQRKGSENSRKRETKVVRKLMLYAALLWLDMMISGPDAGGFVAEIRTK